MEGFTLTLKVKMVMMNHLSDIQTGMMKKADVNDRLNFVKYLILNYRDTETEIDPDEVYAQYHLKQAARFKK